jgi:hypothetical protein
MARESAQVNSRLRKCKNTVALIKRGKAIAHGLVEGVFSTAYEAAPDPSTLK